MSSSQQLVSFEQQGAIGHIVLDNPPENRITREFYAQLGRSARQALRAGCRAVLIRSAGPDFSLGGVSQNGRPLGPMLRKRSASPSLTASCR
jgi:enoyl-CoA hydratase/carnithine racemase